MVSTQKWVPYKVKDWKQTPMSIKCNGCHTTGFNPKTYEFKEFGIGCEACHGPGSKHIQNRQMEQEPSCKACHGTAPVGTDIIVSYKASVCGQCHNRGNNKPIDGSKGKFNFPINFKPGDNLKPAFNPLTQKKDKKGKYWWGNGISKNRHQEYADWQNSKHSKALKNLHEKKQEGRGEKTDQCLTCHSTDYLLAKEGQKPNLDTAEFGVTCAACHDPHGFTNKRDKLNRGTRVCAKCHIDSMATKTRKGNRPHYPCPPAAVTCADCHMPRIVSTGGDFTLRSHAFQIVKPQTGMESPNSCQNGGCHNNKNLDWAVQAFRKSYPDFMQNR